MTTKADAKAALQRLTERIEALQTEGSALRRTIASTGELVERHERLLRDLERGVFSGRRRGRFLIWISTALLAIAGFVGYVAYLKVTNRPDTSRLGLEQLAPVRPHLLITSQPSGAKILVGASPRGRTPRLVAAPHTSGRVMVKLEKRGYVTSGKLLVVDPGGGVHWHAVLKPDAHD